MQAQSPRKTSEKKQLTKTRLSKTGFDFSFLITVILLLAIGLLMVFSASYPSAYYYHNNGMYFINKQLLWAAIGVIAMIFTSNFDYRRYKKLAPLLLGISIVLLIAVLLVGT
ncbi:MAG: FtsW/RodA/SpoVE family cell cycle protein, partial [Clostridia bacterium]|nr:FtsW/RodA/SpoVE family cell cycle protein [Clostridia bacterium]